MFHPLLINHSDSHTHSHSDDIFRINHNDNHCHYHYD